MKSRHLTNGQLIRPCRKHYQLAYQIHQSQFLIGGLWLGLAEARRVATASGTDLLRVMISKSLNFIFGVTVRPRVPLTESFATASRKIRNFEDIEVLILEQLGERILHELEDGCCFDPTYPQVR